MFSTLVIAAVSLQKLNWNGPPKYVLSGSSLGHTYSVTLKQANFQIRDRKLLWVVQEVEKRGHGEIPVHALRKRSDWDGNYSSIFAGFSYKGELKQFLFDDGSEYREVVGKPVLDKVKKTTELTGVSAVIDGKRINVPQRLYWDLLDPNLGKEYVSANISRDGKTLMIKMFGSDSTGGYRVVWTLKKGGACSRKFLDME